MTKVEKQSYKKYFKLISVLFKSINAVFSNLTAIYKTTEICLFFHAFKEWFSMKLFMPFKKTKRTAQRTILIN